MYLNFWYPMAACDEVTDSPLQVRALGQRFALFRDEEGAAHCLADVCVHRGGSLSGGKRIDNCLQCPYHGWRFDSSGQCKHIPTLTEQGRIPARARVDAYPVIERYGVVFAFLGDLPEDERPPILDIREYGQEGWSTTRLVYPWDANVERVIENGLDATHTEFVHPSAGLQGSFNPDELQDSRLEKLDWGNVYLMKMPKVDIAHGHHGPNQQWTHLGFNMPGFQGHFHFYSFVRPVDENSVVRYLFNARDFQLGEEMDQTLNDTTLGFEKEDRPVIEAMEPRESPLGSAGELLLPEDEIMLAYRRSLENWRASGWHIDSSAVNADRRNSYAIPSPARRDGGNWVRKSIPVSA